MMLFEDASRGLGSGRAQLLEGTLLGSPHPPSPEVSQALAHLNRLMARPAVPAAQQA